MPSTITMDIVTLALTGVAVPIIVYFILDFKKRIEKALLNTSEQLRIHSENMGKAKKAIHGDMLKVQENLLVTEERLFMQFKEMKTEIHSLQLSLDSHVAKMEIESMKRSVSPSEDLPPK